MRKGGNAEGVSYWEAWIDGSFKAPFASTANEATRNQTGLSGGIIVYRFVIFGPTYTT